jgi:LPS sulfotransferase NodH
MTQRRAYVICTAPRSGSTLLCHMLRATGVAGWPGSHFHVPDLNRWRRYCDLPKTASLADTLARGRKMGCDENGLGMGTLFGLRVQPRSRSFLFARLRDHVPNAASDRDAFEATFGPATFIFLKRDDVMAQAVSLLRAEQSGLWHKASNGSEIERVAPPQAPRDDREALTNQIAEFEQATVNWRAWFEAQDITPLEVRPCPMIQSAF